MKGMAGRIGIRAAIVGIGLSTGLGLAMGGWTPALAQPSSSQPSRGVDGGPGGDLSVTVHYRGKAPVSRGHEIGVFLFDTPDIGGTRKPIAIKVLESSGATAHFIGVTAPVVYVAVSYDESGKHAELWTPPPPGAPVHVFGIKGDPNVFFENYKGTTKPTPVTTGPGSKVTITFDDTYRSK
jgi:hypothetical protein